MKLNKSFKLLVIAFVLALAFLRANASFAYDPEAVKSYNQGVDFSKEGNYQEAILLFRKSITIDPSFTDAYYNLGSLYEFLGNNDKALEAYEELVKTDPSDDDTAYKVGTIYFLKNNYKKALTYLSLVSSGNSRYVESQKLMKRANLKISELNAAQKASAKAPVKVPPKVAKPVKKELSKVVLKNFNGPTGITKDFSGNLYVANYVENSIIQIAPDGKRKVLITGNPISGPIGLAADSAGNIYVASYLSNAIIKVNPQGKILSVLKGINKPYYIYIDKSGILYISEQGTDTVIKLKI